MMKAMKSDVASDDEKGDIEGDIKEVGDDEGDVKGDEIASYVFWLKQISCHITKHRLLNRQQLL